MARSFEYRAGISLPGNPAKPNEDAFCHSLYVAAVFDGATPLCDPILPADSDAAWIARKGAEGVIAHSELGAHEALRRAAADAEHDFKALRLREPRENHELPLASMMLVAASGDALDFFWFGDCTALIGRPGAQVEVVGDALASRGAEANRVAKLSKSSGRAPTAGVETPEYLAVLRKARNRVNTGSHNWAFSPDTRCADHAKHARSSVPPGSLILLCTDGFLALVSDYGRYQVEEFLSECQSKGLKALSDELREIERSDPLGSRFPRFKMSDDATALLLEVAD